MSDGMSDGTGKREKRAFEPPPWEREAFEELARKRAEETPAEPLPVVAEIRAARQETATPAAAEQGAGDPALSEAQVDTMLLSLAAEEPDSWKDWTVGAWVAGVLGLFGLGITIYGLVAMTRGVAVVPEERKAGTFMMGLIFSGFGMILLGMAAWVGLRAMRRRGE